MVNSRKRSEDEDSEVTLIKSGTSVRLIELAHSRSSATQGPRRSGKRLTVREQQQHVHQSRHRRSIPAERRGEGRVRQKISAATAAEAPDLRGQCHAERRV